MKDILGHEGILSAQNSQEVDKCESHAPYLMYQLATASDILLTGVNNWSECPF